MEKYLVYNKAVHHMVVTPSRFLFEQPDILQPMQAIYDTQGNVLMHKQYNFVLTKKMSEMELFDTIVTKWITPNSILQSLDMMNRTLINKIKEFCNGNRCAVFLHKTTSVPDRFCNWRKNAHIHLVVESTNSQSRDLPKYRMLENILRSSNVELYCKKVMSNPDGLLEYMLQDVEKEFLGTNHEAFRRRLLELRMSRNRIVDVPNLADNDEDTFVDIENDVVSERAQQPSTSVSRPPLKRKLFDTTDTTTHDDDDESLNQPKAKRSKNLLMLDTLKMTMKQFPHCANFSELVNTVRGTSHYDSICNIFLDNRAEKIWNLARDYVLPKNDRINLLEIIASLPDELENTMSPEMTLALFNSWCQEQAINGTHLAWYLISRLQNRIYKKIGLYLHGASNSGKTYWSTTLFSPLSSFVGKMASGGGRFLLQECERKKIIIGEEIGITTANVDHLKELMSGERTTCERKGRSCVSCKASLVLLNSNNMPASNVPSERQALINRMHLVRNLKPSTILKSALKYVNAAKPNIKFLLLIDPPTDEQLRSMEANMLPEEELIIDNKYHRTLLFKDCWDNFMVDPVNGIGHVEEDPEPPLPLSSAAPVVQTPPSTKEPSLHNSLVPYIIEDTEEEEDNEEEDDDDEPFFTAHESTWRSSTDVIPESPDIIECSQKHYSQTDNVIPEPSQPQQPSVYDVDTQLEEYHIQHGLTEWQPSLPPLTISDDEDIPSYQPTLTSQDPSSSYTLIQRRLANAEWHEEPFDNGPVFDTVDYYIVPHFSFTGDMGIKHKSVADVDEGTVITYITALENDRNVHLMTVLVPRVYKHGKVIRDVTINMINDLITKRRDGKTYVCTKKGFSVIPQMPNATDASLSERDIANFKELFCMFANLPTPTKPSFKLFLSDITARPSCYSQWPDAYRYNMLDADIVDKLAKRRLEEWVESQSKSTLDDVDGCFGMLFQPSNETIQFARNIIANLKFSLRFADFFLRIIQHPSKKIMFD